MTLALALLCVQKVQLNDSPKSEFHVVLLGIEVITHIICAANDRAK